MKRKFLLFHFLLLTTWKLGISQVAATYLFYQGDSLQGMNMDSLYQATSAYRSAHHLNESEFRKALYVKEQAYVYQKFGIPLISPAFRDPNKNLTLTSACNNVDFENGNFAGWTGYIGFNINSGFPLFTTATGINTLGLNSNESTCSYHTLVSAGAGNDLLGGFPELDPGGGSYALRLGGYNVNRDNNFSCAGGGIGSGATSAGEIIQQTFRVTASNSLFTYKYAILLNDGGHAVGEQPYFMIEVLDSLGNGVPCLQYYIQILSGVIPPGFTQSPYVNTSYDNSNIYFLPWSANSLNLSAYMGQTITVRFTAAGCTHGGHFGYGYVDCSCSPVEINLSSPTACRGSSISMTAPPGADSYAWTKVPAGPGITGPSTNQTCTADSTGHYQVTIKTGACSYTLDTTITIYPYPVLKDSVKNVSCNGLSDGTATVMVSGASPPFSYSWSSSPGLNNGTLSGLSIGSYTIKVTATGGCAASLVIPITQPSLLTVAETHQNLNCYRAGTGSIQLAPSGGTTPYTFSWSPGGATTSSITGLQAGTYQYTVTDANHCSSVQQVTLTEPPMLVLVTSNKNVSCFGGNDGWAIASASGGTSPYLFSWLPAGGTSDTAHLLTSGIYTCTLTDSKGCHDTQSVKITQPAAPLTALSYTFPVSCNGGKDGIAAVIPKGGTAPYHYSWSPGGALTDTVKMLPALSYTCLITDANGCTNTLILSVAQPASLTVKASTTPVSCYGGSNGTASVLVSGGITGTYQYSWQQGGSTSTALNLPAGADTCWIKDQNGCQTKASVWISQPPALTAVPTINAATCGLSNGSAAVAVTGGTPPVNYLWAPIAGKTPSAINLPAGSYSCLVTDSNQCSLVVPVTITNVGNLPVASISASGPVTFCSGKSIVLTAAGGGTYSWSTGSLLPAITVVDGGTYQVHVINACGVDSASQTVVVMPLPNPAIAGINKICKGDSAKLTASGGTSYLWSNGATSAVIYVKNPGTYTVTATNTCGSVTATDTLVVNEVHALYMATPVSGTAPLSVSFQDNSSSNTVNWDWNLGDNNSATGSSGFTHLYNSPGIYTTTLLVTDVNGCTGSFQIPIDVLEPPSWLVIPNVFTPNNDGKNDLFVVSSDHLATLHMKIYDRWGVFMTELTRPDEGWDGYTPGGAKAADGTYYYLLQASGLDGKNYQFQGFFMLIQ